MEHNEWISQMQEVFSHEDEISSQIAERIRNIFHNRPGLDEENCEELGWDIGPYRSLVSKGTRPPTWLLTQIVKKWGVDPRWLLTGKGESGRRNNVDEDLLTVVLAHGRAVDKYLEDIHRLEIKNAELEGGLKNLARDEKTTVEKP